MAINPTATDAALRLFIEDILKSQQNLDPELKEAMVQDLTDSAHAYINKYLVASLNEQQVIKFNEFIKTNPSDEATLQYFVDRGVDVNEVVLTALAKLKQAYLG